MLDFTDGSYARMINRTTHLGHVLDSFLGTLRLIILFGLAYSLAETPAEKYVIVFLLLIYALYREVKFVSSSPNSSNLASQQNNFFARSGSKMNYLIRIPFGFGTAHFYLYITLWFLFDFVYFLFVLYVVGLFSIFMSVRLLLRKYS